MNGIQSTDFQFYNQVCKYAGKVRDVYNIDEQLLAIVATDRVSAFDVVFDDIIPYKGQVLNQLSAFFFRQTEDICRHHLVGSPDPNVTVALKCEPYPIEVIVRAHLCGHAWRLYKAGEREVCGVVLPDGLNEHDPLPEPILTPSTKSHIGHDIDITEREIIKSGLISAQEYLQIKHYALTVFAHGAELARGKGLILADTKYEFGHHEYEIYLIDELHTPDSSRYYVLDGFEERQAKGEEQPQFSKEYLRKWLMKAGFQGQEGVAPPKLSEEIVTEMQRRYIEVFETLTGTKFTPEPNEHRLENMFDVTNSYLESLFEADA